MKFQLLLVAALAVVAFAAPVPEYIDPDCIEDELVDEEPAPEIEAEFALGVPDLVWNGNDAQVDDECEEEPVAAPTPEPEEECEDPLPTTNAAPTTEAEECVDETLPPTQPPKAPEATEPACEDDPIPTTPADECEDDGPAVENAPILHDIVVEPAMVDANPIIISEQHMMPDIEECEEY